MEKLFVVSLGCPKNLVDTEKLIAQHFKQTQLTNQAEEADIILINTCSFILPAKEESIDTILEYSKLKEKHPNKRIVVTGCLWEQYQADLEKELPEVEFLSNKKIFLSQERFLTTSGFAYLKIAEGCNKGCSFCTIPIFKGAFQSRPLADILAEASLLSKKVKELILVSQDTSYYGIDLYGEPKLKELLQALSKMDFQWIRVMYFYPQFLDEELLQVMANSPNICKYIDIPFQHLSAGVLKSMKRWGSYQDYLALVQKIRKIIPDATLLSTFLSGYPLETEEDYEFLLQGLEALELDRAGFFMYSDEEDTVSAKIKHKIPEDIIEKRYERAVFVQEEISEKRLKRHLNKIIPVLIEGYDEKLKKYLGRSEYDAPEIDGLVFVKSKEKLKFNEIYAVKILKNDLHNLFGEVKL